MNIVIIADFCGDLTKNENGRFQYLADMLSAENNVELITGNFHHGEKEYFREINREHDYKITLIEEERYSKNICLKRLKSHYMWGKKVRKYLEEKTVKPDVVYCAMPPVEAAAEAGSYCKKNNIRFIVDIQDLWPEAFEMVFNVPVLSRLAFLPIRIPAEKAYKCADCICAVSETYTKRGLNVNRQNRGLTVFLGTDMETFDYNREYADLTVEKNENELWIGYCGSLSDSYDIKCVIDAFAILNKEGFDNIKFIVMGDGYKREEFEKYADDKNISAEFHGRLAYDRMCRLLCMCDIAVNPIVKGSAASIINKHADYAFSGLPVLNTQESPEYRQLVEEYNMGFNCKCEDADELAEKMSILIKDKDLRKQMGDNARRCGEEKFNRSNTYKKIIEEIEKQPDCREEF